MSLKNDYKGWEEYWVGALLGDDDLSAQLDVVLVPNIDYAFKKARQMWPWASAWEVMGTVDPNDKEVCNRFKKRIIERPVRETKEHKES